MACEVKILVGTMTGTAELVADEILEVLKEKGADVDILLMETLTLESMRSGPVYILCTSTYGQGDVPDNAKAFYDMLRRQKPNLTGIEYGIFALGDSTYKSTFCFGGKKFDKIFEKLGARRVGDRMEHDASSGELPEDLAAQWADDWYMGLQKAT